jgi:taurine dioxygenase
MDMLTKQPVRATCDALGVELPNVDLSKELTREEIEVLKQASDDAWGIVVFTNQKPEMSISDHIRFARAVADHDNTELEPHAVAAPAYPEAPELLEIVREADAHVVFGENWHSDNSFHTQTCSYSILRGAVVPRLGVNDTLFASTEAAFEALSPTMQSLLLDLKAFHSANRAYGSGHPNNSRAAMERTKGGASAMSFRQDAPILETDVLQPVVTRHPRTGRLGIFVSPTFTTHIDGMRPEESAALLRFLYHWIARPEFCTRVSWRPNQVVMWDNRSLSHKGIADDVSERRVVHRVSVRGTAPINHRGETFSRTHVPASNAALFDFEDQLSRTPFSYSNGVHAAM